MPQPLPTPPPAMPMDNFKASAHLPMPEMPDVMGDKANAAFKASVGEQVKLLADGVDRLAARMQRDIDEKPRRLMAPQASKALRTELSTLPSAPATIFCEFDELCVRGSTERVLLGDAADSKRDARADAYQALRMTLDDAAARCADSNVTLDPDFVDFVEQCSVHRVNICILSGGMKSFIRLLMRNEGIGHVEVLAHDMCVDRGEGNAWRVALRDGSETGHDKAESVRRALRSQEPAPVILVGRTACDFAPIRAGLVDCCVSAADTPLAKCCTDAGVQIHHFTGWSALARRFLPPASSVMHSLVDTSPLSTWTGS